MLEADVISGWSAFADRVREKRLARGAPSLTPAQHVVRIVRDEMLALFGTALEGSASRTPRVILMLGRKARQDDHDGQARAVADEAGKHPLVVSTDVRRPAAIEQLSVLAKQLNVRALESPDMNPVARATSALTLAKNSGFDTLIVDTAGRLHIDDELMQELAAIRAAVDPTDMLYVADAMTGQDAVKSAGEFHRQMNVTGVVLTKMDGDARGGAALSVVGVSACRSRSWRGRAAGRSRDVPGGSARVACSAWATCCR